MQRAADLQCATCRVAEWVLLPSNDEVGNWDAERERDKEAAHRKKAMI